MVGSIRPGSRSIFIVSICLLLGYLPQLSAYDIAHALTFAQMKQPQVKAAINISEIRQSPSTAIAVRTLGEAQKAVLIRQEEAQQAAEKAKEVPNDAAAQKEAAEKEQAARAAQEAAAKAAEKVAATAEQPAVVDPEQVKKLQEQLQLFRNRSQSQLKFNSTLSSTLVLAGILLTSLASLCGFLGRGKTAGILSIVVAGLALTPKAFPVTQRAEYYRVLTNQCYGLLLESQLQLKTTVEQYNDTVRQLHTLINYEAEKYPAGGDVGQVTQELLKDLEASKTTTVATR